MNKRAGGLFWHSFAAQAQSIRIKFPFDMSLRYKSKHLYNFGAMIQKAVFIFCLWIEFDVLRFTGMLNFNSSGRF